MSSIHIGFEQEVVIISFERTQLCHPFGFSMLTDPRPRRW